MTIVKYIVFLILTSSCGVLGDIAEGTVEFEWHCHCDDGYKWEMCSTIEEAEDRISREAKYHMTWCYCPQWAFVNAFPCDW